MKNFQLSSLISKRQESVVLRASFLAVLLLMVTVFIAEGCNRSNSNSTSSTANSDSANAETRTSDSAQAPDKAQPPKKDGPTLKTARELLQLGDSAGAKKIIEGILVKTPDDIDALKLLAMVHSHDKEFNESASLAIRLVDLDAPNKSGLLTDAFHWHMQAGEINKSESHLRRALELNPNDPMVVPILVQLYNSQGRRHEACEHAEHMISVDFAGIDVLLSLIDRSGPFQLVNFGDLIPKDRTTLFDLGTARVKYAVEGKPDEAKEITAKVSTSIPNHPAVESFYGRLIAERGQDNAAEFVKWLASAPPEIDEFPEYWYALGIQNRRVGDDKRAIRAFGEALRRDPTDRGALREIVSSLTRLKETERAASVQKTIGILDEIFRRADRNNLTHENAMWIAEQLGALIRPWESLRWQQVASALKAPDADMESTWVKRETQIRQWESKSSDARIRAARLKAILGFDIEEFPLPSSVARVKSLPDETKHEDAVFRFANVAPKLGLATRLVSGYSLEERDFLLYQANGAGLAALDYDLDGNCDLYIVQSGGDLQAENGSSQNELYRNLSALSLIDVSEGSQTAGRGFGQGVCVGDLNQDGWPDIVVGNLGANEIFINQGDGTYRRLDSQDSAPSHHWTSTVAIADLNGDHLPEIFEANYIDDETIFTRNCVGLEINCHPQNFKSSVDRVLVNQADGSFRSDEKIGAIGGLPNHSLGCLITDFDGDAGNDVFVSVDGGVNHFFKSRRVENVNELIESGVASGCAVGRNGRRQACMGIAFGDFDGNARPDFAITNFYNEPGNLFLQSESGLFLDEAESFSLARATEPTLGFGTQAFDVENDGDLDLAILNGHIYDARENDIPFRMPPQLLRGVDGKFVAQSPESSGEFWNTEALGRTLLTWDFNRDGKLDLAANSLDQDIVVLANQTEITGHWIELKLIGTQSERDAIGAKVSVVCAGQSFSAWRYSGGYMNQNESVIHVGIGNHKRIEEISIQWPSGRTQELSPKEIDQRIVVVEE